MRPCVTCVRAKQVGSDVLIVVSSTREPTLAKREIMTVDACDTRASRADIGIGLVSCVWAQACRAAGRAVTEPAAIVSLKSHKPGRKSGAYRLEGIDQRVIAKRCQRDTALVEQRVYERVLPEIGLSGLAFYGGFDDPVDPGYRWLLVEDAGSVKPMESDRAMVAEWLARLAGA
jgi:hypothetical protein